jgi:uncharacterized protein
LKFLIPPSEGKSILNTTDVLFKDSDFIYKKQVNQIIKTLKLIKEIDFKKVYGVMGEKAKLIHNQNLVIKKSKCTSAINRYSGTVFSNIDYQSFNEYQKEFFNNHFLIFSGLFGMLSPMTLIPNYKLKMNVFQLHKLWNPLLTTELNKEDIIFDLLPQIHKKAYTPNRNCKNIDFVLHKKGKKIHAGHFGKVVKGKFIHFVCKNQLTHFEDFIKFEYDGFKWDGEVFLKNN